MPALALLAAAVGAAAVAAAAPLAGGRPTGGDQQPGAPELAGGSSGTAAGANWTNWTQLGRSIKIYVYDLPKHASLSVSEEDRNHNYYFEVVFPKLLRMSALHRVFDPLRADFFYVPAEAAAYWYSCKTAKGCADPVEAERRVIRHLRSVGPFWDNAQERHIVPSLRCPVVPGAPRMSPTFPKLWDGRALQLCLQASKEKVDERRSLHVGYYVPELNASAALPATQSGRDILAVYIGATINRYRHKVAAWMQRSCSDCRAFVLEEHSNASQDVLREYHATLRRARFAIEPPGDTLERMSRDASVLAGAVPVVFDNPEGLRLPQQYLPWAPVLDWSAFSVNFTLTPYEVGDLYDFVPRLERTLRGMVTSGEADRLYTGLTAARARSRWSVDGVVVTLAGMLARHKQQHPQQQQQQQQQKPRMSEPCSGHHHRHSHHHQQTHGGC